MEIVGVVNKMANHDGQTVTLFGKATNLEQEWHKIAANLGSLCEGNKYIEYDKEIARLKLKVLHLQEEVDGCKIHNQNLTSLNDDLVDRVKNLISMQDNQLEQYSTALVLLTKERRDLWHTLSASQKKLNKLEQQLSECRCKDKVTVRDSSDETDSIGSNQDAETNTENSLEVASRIRRNQTKESSKNAKDEPKVNAERNVDCLADELANPVTQKADEEGCRNLDSFESSIESNKSAELPRTPVTPFKPKGLFVNSMIEKIEKKYKLKSFEEPGAERNREEGSLSEQSQQSEEADLLRNRVVELEREVTELRDTCESLSGMLERTYDEMLPSDLQTREDAKDQLIACLRSRLFEAICDLMKVEKSRTNVKSVACGLSLPRAPKAPDLAMPPPTAPDLQSAGERLVASQSDPVLSPSRSKTAKILASPASKLKALREDHYSKLRKFSCWNPRSTEDSA